jgi:hypothetical protein
MNVQLNSPSAKCRQKFVPYCTEAIEKGPVDIGNYFSYFFPPFYLLWYFHQPTLAHVKAAKCKTLVTSKGCY